MILLCVSECLFPYIGKRIRDFSLYNTKKYIEAVDNSRKLINANPKSVNAEIIRALSSKHPSETDLKRLKLLLKSNVQIINQVNVITLMHRCSKIGQNVLDYIPEELVLDRLNNELSTSFGIANALYSMPSFLISSKTAQKARNSGANIATPDSFVRKLLKALQSQLEGCRELFDSQAISNALYGLRGFDDTSAEV